MDLSMESSSSDSNRIGKEITEREAILQFVKLYEQHCAEVYGAIITPQLEKLRNIWQRFWSPSDTLSRDLVSIHPLLFPHSKLFFYFRSTTSCTFTGSKGDYWK